MLLPTYSYEQQRWPALFWGFVDPVWAKVPVGPYGPVPQPHTPPSPWSVTEHQTAGFACAHLLLAGLFVTLDPFPYQGLVDDYFDSQLGLWDFVPSWYDLCQYDQRLTSFKLRMPDHTEYRWLQEGFLPVDPATLFARVRSSPTARIWTGAPGDRLRDAPWANHWEALAAALEAWQIQAIAAEPIDPTASDFTRKMIPHWHHQSPVAAIVFENSD